MISKVGWTCHPSGADPAFGQGEGSKNNETPTFAAAIANVSDHVHEMGTVWY